MGDINFEIVVAYDQHRAIGQDGDMPWQLALPSDLRHFKELTLGRTVVMGRKTYDSIGRALPGRENIVITRNPELRFDNVSCVQSLQHAFERASYKPFLIGGGELYRQALSAHIVQRVYATEIAHTFHDTDTYFPVLSNDEWHEVSRERGNLTEDAYRFDFVTYEHAT